MARAKQTAAEQSAEPEKKYRGKELLRSASGIERDILSIILKPQKLYTPSEAEKLKQKYLNKEVK